MASPIAESWTKATLMVSSGNSRGTGFLVLVGAPDQQRAVVVTNKHVISEDRTARHATRQVSLHMNDRAANGTTLGTTLHVPLVGPDGAPLWREHPVDEIDVFALNVSGALNARPSLDFRYATPDAFATASKRAELDITAGDAIVVVGYPLGLRQGATNYPLIRQGIIATRIGEELWEDETDPNTGAINIIKRRGFLYDGAAIPGSSGSPVILKPEIGRLVGNTIVMGNSPAVLLGIVAQTRFAPIRTPKGDVPSFAGLGFAFDVETIQETLALF